ncbi:MAG: DUF5597 domain-containing protein [Ktedonobacteraceae bacterium]|nr:DUF5597 domain-containing protein [Ktedonobacteraceae bacterium]
MNRTEPTKDSNHTPYLRKQGNATQLIVDGKPFLIIGGELHNSSSSQLEYMQPIWERLVTLNLNTVLAAIFWELMEPEEGVFNFALVDGLIREARNHDLRLIFLWFGSWKNGTSSYIPAWMKQDYSRFPRVKLGGGQSIEVLSNLSEANQQADCKAFAALMRHLGEVDGNEHTVIMVQVENEVGVLGNSRNRSDEANQAFSSPVPQKLSKQLQQHQHELSPEILQRWAKTGFKTSGSWEEIFGSGPGTDEIFMAWNYARYIDSVAAAGKAEYELPMFVNAWLDYSALKPGGWPSGGPTPRMLDIWLAGAPHIDLFCPDIYFEDFQQWCQWYTRRNNPLFIPEMLLNDAGARNIFYAIGQHDAIGTSPFAVDGPENPAHISLSKSYALLKQVAPLILEHQGKGEMAGFVLDKEHPNVIREMGGYELEISLDQIFGYEAERGYGLVIAADVNTFIGVGHGFRVIFRPKTAGPTNVGIATVDEGEYRDRQWIPARRLNGDETAGGLAWRFLETALSTGISRCTIYRYE